MKQLRKVILIFLLLLSIVFYMSIPKSESDIAGDATSSENPIIVHSTSQVPEPNRDFIVCDFDTGTHYEIAASLLASGEHCYIYMQDSMISQIGESGAQSLCESYRTEFDTRIYQTVVDLTGNPNGTIGDIDGDPHVIILINDNPVSYYSQYNEIVHDDEVTQARQ